MNMDRERYALITRPREDAEELVAALQVRGINSVITPMMTIFYLSKIPKRVIKGLYAILFTSRNGVRAFAQFSEDRDFLVFTVGNSTAGLASELGFTNVGNSEGDSEALINLVKTALCPSDGRLLHVSGANTVGNIADALSTEGFDIERHAFYEARPVSNLSESAIAKLRDGLFDYILFFSPRTARIFLKLAKEAKVQDKLADVIAVCLSKTIAEEIKGYKWKDVRVSIKPNAKDLVNMLDF